MKKYFSIAFIRANTLSVMTEKGILVDSMAIIWMDCSIKLAVVLKFRKLIMKLFT